MVIRCVKEEDLGYIYDFIKTAFSTANVADGNEQDYVSGLRKGPNYIPELELVMENENHKIIGHIMLTAFDIKYKVKCLMLGPVCIDIDYRNGGLGKSLIDVACKKAGEMGYEVVFLAGNPNYYNRLGFKSTIDFGLKNSNGYEDKYIMCKELKDNALKRINGLFHFE